VVNIQNGQLVETFESTSKRHITCIYNCDTVGYSIIGLSDGTIEIVNVHIIFSNSVPSLQRIWFINSPVITEALTGSYSFPSNSSFYLVVLI
jgi:hypothetical protein